jgi:hypothetical protein
MAAGTDGEGDDPGGGHERHLWPEFLRLIAERRPRLVFGEQVEAAFVKALIG